MAKPRRALPSPTALIEFLRANPGALGAREIARAFGLGVAQQPALRDMLRRVERSGELARTGSRKFVTGAPLPEIMPVERFASDADGYPLARPVPWSGGSEAPGFRLVGTADDELAIG